VVILRLFTERFIRKPKIGLLLLCFFKECCLQCGEHVENPFC